MSNRWNRVFAAGIVWDPREPLPPELQQRDLGYPTMPEAHSRYRNPAIIYSAKDAPLPPSGPFFPSAGSGQVPQAATTPVAQPIPGKALPSLTVQESNRNVLPPLSITVDASIVHDTASVTVTQLFWNDSSSSLKEAAFTFPLPAGCTVTDFSCRIGPNKIIKGSVKPREDAREAFGQHIRHHDTAAALLEQDTPEIFTTTLGNIPEKTKLKVNLTYITILKRRFDDTKNVITLTIPTSIASRYGETPDDYNDAATSDVVQGLTLEAEIVESEAISSLTSPSHVIAVERRRGTRNAESFADLAGDGDRSNVETALVKLDAGSTFLDKDFVLDIMTTPNGDIETPQAWLEEHPLLQNHKALMVTLPGGFMTNRAPPMQRSEILFLADLSGSMSDKIDSLKSSMQFFLKGIPEGRKFNIWCFGSKYMSWQPCSVEYDEATLNSAMFWVETTFAATMGGTELLPALEAIVAARDKTLMTDIIVLTDGETWRLDQTLSYIQTTRARTEGLVRFFALGIGEKVSHALVDGIAKAGGGYAEVIQNASEGGWEDRVVSMAKAALLTEHIGPLHLEFNFQDQDGNMKDSTTLAEAKRSPADVSALNPFDASRAYFLFDSASPFERIHSVTIEAKVGRDTRTFAMPVTILDKCETTIHKLAARSMLDDLERGRGHIHLGAKRPYPGSWEEDVKVRKEAEELACKWSLVSRWTSFFLAEEPYSPTEEDSIMNGIVEVRASPGDDLLQPRRHLSWKASSKPAESLAEELLPSPASQEPPEAPTSGHYYYGGLVQPDGGNPDQFHKRLKRRFSPDVQAFAGSPLSSVPRSEMRNRRVRRNGVKRGYVKGLSPASDTLDSNAPIIPLCAEPAAPNIPFPRPGPGNSRHGGFELTIPDPSLISTSSFSPSSGQEQTISKSESLYFDLSPSLFPSEQESATDKEDGTDSKAKESDFIRSLLKFQTYDGAIDFQTWATAQNVLGTDITTVLQSSNLFSDLSHPQPTTTASNTPVSSLLWLWTATVYVLLLRDFQSCKPLWELMALKAYSYLEKDTSLVTRSRLSEMRQRLQWVRVTGWDAAEGGGLGKEGRREAEESKEGKEVEESKGVEGSKGLVAMETGAVKDEKSGGSVDAGPSESLVDGTPEGEERAEGWMVDKTPEASI